MNASAGLLFSLVPRSLFVSMVMKIEFKVKVEIMAVVH